MCFGCFYKFGFGTLHIEVFLAYIIFRFSINALKLPCHLIFGEVLTLSLVILQVCARKRKTFVLIEHGYVFGFGWMGFGSLGFPDRGASDKVMRPRILDSLRAHRIAQISTGLYHTVVVTREGQMFGFGDNERAQLGHDMLRGCLEPTEIFLQSTAVNDSCVNSEVA